MDNLHKALSPPFHIFVLAAVSSLLWYPALEARHDGLCLLKNKKVCRWVIYKQSPPWVMAHSFSTIGFFYTTPDTCKETIALHPLPLFLQLKTCYSALIYSWIIQRKARNLSAILRQSCTYIHKANVEFKMLPEFLNIYIFLWFFFQLSFLASCVVNQISWFTPKNPHS